MATKLERELSRQRAQLLRINDKASAEVLNAYRKAHIRLRRELKLVTELIDATEHPRVGWLVAQHQYQTFLQEVEIGALQYADEAASSITEAQAEALDLVDGHTRRLVEASLTGPKEAMARVQARMFSFPHEAFRELVGNASNGTPLGQLLKAIAPHARQKAADALIQGVALGQDTRQISKALREVTKIPAKRAITITRTEVMRAYREGSRQTYLKNPEVIKGWVWQAELSTRTCSACWAMHGTHHTNEESLDGHPRCRCSMAPETFSWKELGFDDIPESTPQFTLGTEAFSKLTPADQRTILGPGKYDAFSKGQVKLDDLVKQEQNATWGTMRREKSLQEALA